MPLGITGTSDPSGKHDVDRITAPSLWSSLANAFSVVKRCGSREETWNEREHHRGCIAAVGRHWVESHRLES